MKPFLILFKRDLRLLLTQGAGISIGLTFFLSLVILFPFGVGPDLPTLKIVGPAILWAGPLLSILLGVERAYPPDFEDGSFDIYTLSGLTLAEITLAKALANWVGSALPLIIISPLFGLMLGMQAESIIGCVISLLIGSPAIVFFGTFCGALTARIKRAGMLIAILAIPFLIPTLIFGISTAVGYASDLTPFKAPLLILSATTLISALICTIGSTLVLRNM